MNDDRRLQLLELNDKAWNGEHIFTQAGKKLDSSIKKNTGFIKKLKVGISKDSKPNLLKDIAELSLEKYLSELVVTANEGLSKFSGRAEDVEACVEVISALHQRFDHQFTPPLMELFLHNFTSLQTECETEKEELFKVSRLRTHVRIFTELYLVGLFQNLDYLSKDNLPPFVSKKLARREPILLIILKEVLNYRFKTGLTTTVATSFVTKFPYVFSNDLPVESRFIDSEVSKLLHSLFKIFTEASITQTIEINKSLHKLKREHQKAQIRTGKSSDEYIEEHDILRPVFERFESAVEILAPVLNLQAPKLEKSSEEELSNASSMITNQQKASSEKIWENEEIRKFYENLPDLSGVVRDDEEKQPADPLKLNDFFAGLEIADTKEAIDELSLKFWKDSLNKKATRRRLLKFLIETVDWSKLRIYARFVASNAEYLGDVRDELIQYLDNGFRSQLRSNKINVKNIIFFSEMVKFMLVPSYLIFHKIRTLVMNIQIPNNIEILTVLFENFGKFLINSANYKAQMEKMVDLIQQKRKEHDLTVSNKCALDNLVVLIYPPSLSKLNSVSKELTPEQKFYRILLRRELHTIPPERVVKLLRRAHWKDESIYKTMISLFTKPGKVSYQSLDVLAGILSGLFPYYRNFVVQVIDGIVEKIERGLEINEFSLNMVRIAEVKYLTSLYNNNLVRIEVLLEVFYKILTFGYPRGRPNPFIINDSDLPDNYFRVHLITTALLSIEDVSSSKNKKLLNFMRLFEFYTLTKEQPLPKEAQIKVSRSFDKLTNEKNFERCSEIIKSAKILSECFRASHTNAAGGKGGGLEVEEDEDEDGEDLDEDEDDEILMQETEKGNGRESENGSDSNEDSGSDLSDGSIDEDSATGSDSEEEDDDGDDEDDEDEDDDDSDGELERRRLQEAHMSKLRSEEELRAEDELEKQFQQLVQDSLDSRKNEKIISNSIPMISSGYSMDFDRVSANPTPTISSGNQDGRSKKVAFTFLSKSGKKTQARTLGLPRNVKFVSGVLEEERKLKAEREKIKNIVLNQKFE
ncbi:LANO_0B05732g1_1 [Lachancea nothofagi CBS 11611]|uniref:LANO_0B05732g1_1 n=1 Tax=Lachancea nothofagi CBS 11611 TaxID=1266666 RepID=A0A1G4IYV8_9SACH|nr:LANO_0B05732g1_1 [Lachancea nothofagi CBS 11611]